MALDYKVFQHSYHGFNGTSTLFFGERDAVLIDTTQLLSDAHRLAAELLLMGKNLTHVYISHFHPDHHFGTGVIQFAFPEARVVALPSVVRDIIFTTEDKVHLWGGMFGKDEPDKVVFPMPLPSGRLELEGEEIQFSDDWDGDSANNTMVWVPSIRVACGTDVVFNDAHVWTAESDAARRKKWRESLNKLKAMNPRVVVPGHCSPEKLQLKDTSGIDFTLRYLDVYEEVLAQAKTGDELVEGMERHYRGMKAVDFGVHWQARLLFPDSCSDRISKLPGIFLDPSGQFKGERAQ